MFYCLDIHTELRMQIDKENASPINPNGRGAHRMDALKILDLDQPDDITQQEQDGNNVHNRMNLFGLAAHHLDDSVRDAAVGDTVGDTVSHRHHQQGEKGRDCDFDVAPFDVLDGAGHHHAHDDEDGGGSAGGDKP